MFAKQENFLSFLKASEKLRIPIYQRKYSWNLKQCKELWKDIIEVGKSNEESNHFIGSVVYIREKHSFPGELDTYLVIDGQQRITTISLILCALCDYLKENPIRDYTKLFEYYLINSKENGEDKYNLLLTKDDKKSYIKLLDSISSHNKLSFDKNDSIRIRENYEFFREEIEKEDFNTFYNGIFRLIFVQIDLERGKDNPQLIFESLNSTGLELNRADLIRNYILMDLDNKEQERLYTNYWYKIESRFNHEKSTLLDDFIRHYLTVKLSSIPVEKLVYEEFKKYSLKWDKIQDLIEDIEIYSKYYSNIIFFSDEDKEINNHFKNLEDLKYTVARPFVMSIYMDYDKDIINKNEFIEVLEMVESYLFRRYICEIPTPSLNKTFADLYGQINKEKYVESIAVNFILKAQDRHYKRFPDDEEFKEKFLLKDIYNLKSRNYILDKLENYNHKEHLIVEDYTIEHIMPQTLNNYWKESLGDNWEEIHKNYLHTIGNLTLTGYNSELSNKSFIEKRDMEGGFKDSHIKLNHFLAGKSQWNEELIIKRAKELLNLSVNIWKYPNVTENIVELKNKIKQPKVYSLESHENLNLEPNKLLFEKIRAKILNIDSSVSEEPKKNYIAYKSPSNFLNIVPYKKFIALSLSIPFDEIKDSEKKCRDIESIWTEGSGLTEFKLSSVEDIDYAFDLIKQAFDYVTYNS
jgi:uncharacterized protein with ParB-like and HNH nuclease domain/predicted transport protein